MHQAQVPSQESRQAEMGRLYVVDYTDPHQGIKGLVAKGDESEWPTVFWVLPGTDLIISEIPAHLQAKWNVGNSTFAVACKEGVDIEGYGPVSFDELEPGILALVRAGSQ